MTDLRKPNVPFEDLGIDLPVYKDDGRKVTQPFSTSKHDLLRREMLGSKGVGGEKRSG